MYRAKSVRKMILKTEKMLSFCEIFSKNACRLIINLYLCSVKVR